MTGRHVADDMLGTEGRRFVPVGWRRSRTGVWRFAWRCIRCGYARVVVPARHRCGHGEALTVGHWVG